LKKILIAILILASSLICMEHSEITNLTRPGGYALGEAVSLSFSVSGTKPDSLEIRIFEKKTGYLYDAFAGPEDCGGCGRYEYMWDGRKPDGSWPAGGRYWVFAVIPEYKAVSDTVEIGLTD